MNSFLRTNRLRIADYFSDLKATVDVHVETFISENQHDRAGIDKLNKAREEWFKEADECESSNLAELEKRKDRDLELDDENLLKRFCFVFEFEGDVLETGCFTWRFFSTDIYMSPSQIACFQVMIDFLDKDNCNYAQVPHGLESVRLLFKSVEFEKNDRVQRGNCFPKFRVKNLNLSATTLRHNLVLIKTTAEKLFSFNEIELGCSIIDGIREEAAFLFTRLTTLRINDENNGDILIIKKIIEELKKIGQLEFISLNFPCRHCPDLEIMGRELLSKINGLGFYFIELNRLCPTDKDNLENLDKLVLKNREQDDIDRFMPDTAALPALTELVLYECDLSKIDLLRLADNFPQLENLVLKAGPPVFLNYPFRTMNNMRVLKLENVALQSFEIIDGGCMPLLEEFYLHLAYTLDSLARIDSFPDFPKFTKLSLRLHGVKWIDPKAFDHLKQLTFFEIQATELVGDTFETGVAARSMSFHVACKVLKLTSILVSNSEELKLIKYDEQQTTKLETLVPLNGLKRLTTRNWANEDLPFHQMTNLDYVTLGTNDLIILKSGQLRSLFKLRVLEMISCYSLERNSKHVQPKLRSVLLKGLPTSLKHLTIAGFEDITSVEPNTFEHLPNLEKLSLENNSIEHIEPAAFNNLNKLTSLTLRNNMLTDFRFDEPLANAEPCCLKVLNLSVNQLNIIPKRSVTNLPKSLVNLDLSINEITGIESGAFEDLVNLRSLNLERNKQKSFETLDLNNILNNDTCKLQSLDISRASVKTIQWRDYSKEKEERTKTTLKRKRSEDLLAFPVKSLRSRVLVCVHERQDSCLVTLNKLADEGIIRIRIVKSLYR